jgi:hypothetical protein
LPAGLSAAHAAILVITLMYVTAALFNLGIPDTGARYPRQQHGPLRLISDFADCFNALWRDRLGQISLAVTTLLWGAGATLQFIVLKWAESSLGLTLSEGTVLQAFVAVGVAIGAMIAAAKVPLKRSLTVLPAGVVMGGSVMLMAFYTRDLFPPDWVVSIGHLHVPVYMLIAYVFLTFIGALSGFFVVPMNALLQHRGHLLLSAGHSIAVQNFNENLSILVMLCLYAVLVWLNVPVTYVIVLFSLFVVISMTLIMRLHRRNQRLGDPLSLLGDEFR